MGLQGKIVALTGAAGGLGSVMTRIFAERGAAVAALDLDGGGLRALISQLDGAPTSEGRTGHVLSLEADLSERKAAAEAIARIERELGPIDALVNNATWATYQTIENVDQPTLDRMLAAGFKQVVWTTQAAVAPMTRRGAGAIVNFSSISALTGMANSPVYAAIKAGIDGFTRALAVDLGRHGIRVNSVAPSAIPSPMSRRILDEASWEGRRRRTPLGRVGTPEDVAHAVAFLISDDAAFITGETLRVDGGYTIGGAIPGVDVAPT